MAKIKLSGFARDISGKMGNLVFADTKEGTVMRDRVTDPFNPNTAAQQSVRGAFTTATRKWSTLTAAEAAAWNAYAAVRPRTQRITGKKYTASGFNWFVALSTKFILVNGTGATVPTTPPTTNFSGDTITVTIAASAGGATFTASGANAAGVTTELLIQKLANGNVEADPGAFRTVTYKAFNALNLTYQYLGGPGTYVAAYRFVKTATGEDTGLVTIGEVNVTMALAKTEKGKKAA